MFTQTERERVAKFLNADENGTLSYQRSAFSDQLGKDDSYRKAG